MTSPGTACLIQQDRSHSRTMTMRAPAPRGHLTPLQHIRSHPELMHLTLPQGNEQGGERRMLSFAHLDEGQLPADVPFRLPGAWILPVEKDALIGVLEDDDESRVVLTARRGSKNECIILFDASYRKVCVSVLQPPSTNEATITFLRHTTFAHLYAAHYEKSGSGCIERMDKLAAQNLHEIQGIVWRGMAMGIERIELIP